MVVRVNSETSVCLSKEEDDRGVDRGTEEAAGYRINAGAKGCDKMTKERDNCNTTDMKNENPNLTFSKWSALQLKLLRPPL